MLLATVDRLSRSALALHALVLSASPVTEPAAGAQVGRLAQALDEVLQAAALRALKAPGRLPPLRPLYEQLAAARGARSPAFCELVDGLVDAANALQELLRRGLPAPSAPR